ncbi:DNA gyrase subunit A [Engelhardtia mirabilis]|uniref:DNA gyrase subunit A n=1 Tax=Engelhardtia mirabilis TaxID=2528011 RepID=A0A518BT07_9BACT|nr:DNA gyrase subunit A [Planctomycetes bacterium Pla133]QDV04423.1 DNA gyrase subunit A [Planctomycetes bacterium Pla86]
MSDTQTPPSTASGGHIEPRLIELEMSESYLTYALSVIHSRALPDVRDGLKPSQRRILVAMNDLRLRPNAKYRKCANIAGTTSGEYHPHGESVIYPTLVRMAQKFSLRYPLIDGQGNFGSIDGDPPAAMRYTEARMAGPSVEMLTDLDKETVDYQPNYDERLLEPTVLPGRFPNLLCNGSDGIAVGMATSLPPHNLREVSAAIRAVLDDENISIRDLIEHVPGPDFPTGGMIMGRSGIYQAYTTGRGRAIVRARHHVEEGRGKKEQLVFTEIPYQVRKVAIIEKIVEIVKDGRVTGISDVRDESDRDGLRLIVELKKNEDPEVILKQLFQFTPLQSTCSIINLALVDGQPRTLTLRGLIDEFVRHRKVVIRRRTMFLLRKAEERKHIVEGLRIAVDNIDEVIRIIRASADTDEAKRELMSAFTLSLAQAQAIVDMRLGRLTGLEREKLEDEFQKLVAEIADLSDILQRDERVVAIIRDDLDDVEARHGDDRRTEISDIEVDGSFNIEELITEEMMVVTFSRGGYLKRTGLDTYRAQGRGGRGVKGSESKEGDAINRLFLAGTHDYVLFFSNHGKVYWLKVYQIPEGGRTSKGRAIANLIELAPGEEIQSLLRVRNFDEEGFVFFATKAGTVKKTLLEAYSRPKKTGIRAISLEEGDEVVGAALARPGDTILLASAGGRAIHFDEQAARPMGRVSRGVRGMRVNAGDRVVSLIVVPSDVDKDSIGVVTACTNGFGKRTLVSEYPIKGRGGQGVINIKVTERNGPVISFSLTHEGDELMYISSGGMIVRSRVADMRSMGRNTQGVRLVSLKDGDEVVAMQTITAEDLELESRNQSEEDEVGEAGAEVGDGEVVAEGSIDVDDEAQLDDGEDSDDDSGDEEDNS